MTDVLKNMDEMKKVCPMCQGENCDCKCEGCDQKAMDCSCKCDGCDHEMKDCTCNSEEKCSSCHNPKSACSC